MPSREDYILEAIRRDSYATMRYLGDFPFVPLHKEWHDLLNTIPRFALKAPTGHAKTTNFIYYIAWLIGKQYHDPNLFIVLFCCNFREAKFRVQAVGEIINSEKYKKLFDWVKPDKNNFNKEYLKFHTNYARKDPQLLGLGYDSSWTGIRMSRGFMDDVVDFKTAFQYDTQQKYIRTFKTDLKNRMIPGAGLCYVYTPITKTDLSAEIEEEKLLPVHSYDYRNYENDGKLLWEDYWTREAIEKKRDEEPLAWSQGNLLIPLTSDERLIFSDGDFHFMANMKIDDKRPQFALDLATGSGLDDSCISIGYDFTEFKYFHDIILVDLKIKDLVNLLINLDLKYNPSKIYFESNAFQKVFGDLLPRNLMYKSEGSHTSKTKKEDVHTGLGAFAAQIANRKVIFNESISEVVIKQFISYPFVGKDDAVMSAWILWENICNVNEGRIF